MIASYSLPRPLVNGVAVRPIVTVSRGSIRFFTVSVTVCASSTTINCASGQRRRETVWMLQTCTGRLGRKRTCSAWITPWSMP
jgi:hypothetical protein